MSGKTVIGQMAADKMKWPFIDTDRLIEEAYMKKTGTEATCREIFREEGPIFFRDLEKQQIASLSEKKNCVISLGGGALLDPDNRPLISALGCVVYLKTSPEELWKRVQARGVPAYLDPEKPEKAFLALAEKRVADYEAIATATIDTANLSLEEIVDRVVTVAPTTTS